MNNFNTLTLGELLDDRRAELQTGPFGTMFSASEYCETGVPVIAVQDIGENELKHEKLVFVNDETAERLSRYRVEKGDIIFGRKGAVDRRALIKDKEIGWIQGSDCIRLRLKKGLVPSFVSYQFGTDSYKDWMMQFSTGTSMPSLNQAILRLLPIIDAPFHIQQAISQILSSFDNKIELLSRQNSTIEALAQTYFRQWFIEAANENWEEKGLDGIADFLNGLPLQNYPCKSGEPMNVIKIKELNSGYSDNSDICSADVPEKYIVRLGDIIFSWSGSLVVDIWKYDEGALNQHLFKVTSDKYPKWFYHYWIKYHLPEFRVIAESKATTMGHIQRGHLTAAKVLVPSDGELQAMSNTLSPLVEKIERNNAQILTLQKLRDTLLPKLISGEVRVEQ